MLAAEQVPEVDAYDGGEDELQEVKQIA